MAELKDTSRIDVVVDNKQAINDLGKQQARYSALNAEIKNLERDVNKFKKAQRTINNKEIDKNSRAYKNAQKTVQELSGSVDRYNAARGELDKLTTSIEKQQKALGLQGQTLGQLTRQQQQLRRAIKNTTTEGTTEYKRMQEQLVAINTEVSRQNRNLRATGSDGVKSLTKVNGVFGTMKEELTDLVGIGGRGGLWGALIAGIALATREAFKLDKEFTKIGLTIERFTGQSGAVVDDLAVRVRAVSNTFDKDFNDVLRAANSLSKQMEISFSDALNLIETGFLKGADANGEFLKNVEQYPIQFKQAGKSAEDFIRVAIQQGIGGDFDDKLLDTVKELNLRLKELTPAAEKALLPLGKDFASKTVAELRSGSRDVISIFNDIVVKARELGLNAQQTQTLIADLGGGPLEDLGGLERAFDQLNKAMEINLETTDEMGSIQKESLEIQKELDTELQRLTDGLSEAGNVLLNIWNKGWAVQLKLLNDVNAAYRKYILQIDDNETKQDKLIRQLPSLRKEYDDLVNGIQNAEEAQRKYGITAVGGIEVNQFIRESKTRLEELIPILTQAEELSLKRNMATRDAIASEIEGDSIRITQLDTKISKTNKLTEAERNRINELRTLLDSLKQQGDKIDSLSLEVDTPDATSNIDTNEKLKTELKTRLDLIRAFNENRLKASEELRIALLTASASNATSEKERIKIQRDLELIATEQHFDKLKELAEKFGLDTSQIFQARRETINRINKQSNEQQEAEDKKSFEARVALLKSFTSSITSIASSLADLGVKNQKFQKSLAFGQITIDTAVALSNVISSAKGLTGVDLIAQILAGTAVVLSSFARVSALLSSSKTPAAPKFAKGGQAKGPSHSEGGIPGWVKNSGMIEFEGGEFITNKKATAKNLDIISTINSDAGRTNFSLSPRYDGGGMVIPQAAKSLTKRSYQDGGFVAPLPNASPQQGSDSAITETQNNQNETLDLLRSINARLAKLPTLKAIIAREDFDEAFDEKVELDEIDNNVDL